ncbi:MULTISPECIES: bifunctional metallophosphatase/5'-nucleotidase [Streptomyces]|uniref:Bifunctional metallophosphatase/5'-nucleotidase n=1 Tax=Streptomyces caniscabiei TaxID=2746961 RepID=A0ABU4MS16_9ACTN|nr:MULTISPECIES: bifunctional metallophosphatase/5'-nucleotidase [Streptomyces]MBE4738074.1 5'-nucleotidase C-terminal domain-containing protein [Streptomyces caniscabiei]MBE4756837.1 5'-nucleotidase C-terminal domain-containing protein [Streptomyces caniscabiei]MBE4773777.1 5'-nucleotidase C-terminal domain-containing protein [Streptomyces caniscabiei]MBE4785653.1 5'-nucleotidase C-terminal domain-containing protein [Streptomyces caniscabiei]MBE4796996.1 5'-nucleotidase C-terminal domain-cont
MSATPQAQRRRSRRNRILAAAAGLATVGALAAAIPASAGEAKPSKPGKEKPARYQDVQLLSFNDLHGNLEPPAGSSGRVTELHEDGTTTTINAGGVEYLATHLREARRADDYTITAAAGDMVGASPLISGLFHDEPTIEALNGLDLDVTSVGNHEFDEGAKELARLQKGGCHPTDGCYVKGKKFKGADFPYLAANVIEKKTGKPLLKPYWVWKKNGVKVGFIGVTLEDTPGVVSAEGVKGLKFKDEVQTINKYAKELERQGVKSVVALIHEGGLPASQSYNYDCDSPGAGDGISGPIVDIAKNITPKVDAVVTGHTHAAYACTINDPAGKPRMVTSAASFGRLYTDTTLTYDRKTGDISRTAVDSANHVVTRDVEKAADMTALISRWNTLAAPIGNRAIGHISADVPNAGTESPMGDLIADAQYWYGKTLDPEVDLALMNPGGVRAPLTYAAKGTEGDGVVTYAEGFTVQPFSNTVNLQNFTGAQLIQVLKEQVSGTNAAVPKVLLPSSGLTYTLDLTKSGADRVVTGTIKLNGAAIDPAATYRVATNSFLAGGGDGFPTLGQGTNDLVGADDLAALEQYLLANSSAANPIAPPAANRITIINN